MKLLLTSGGITNDSIRNALVEMMGKPIEEASVLFVPTAAHTLGPQLSWLSNQNFINQSWKEFGVLELTALPSIGQVDLRGWLEAADAILVGGGDPLYLSYWMQKSGVAELVPELGDTVYVGLSGGSVIMAPNIGERFVTWRPPGGGEGDKTLGVVDFAIYPHVDHVMVPQFNMADAEKWAAQIGVPGYAIDEETAIKVMDGVVEVVSEGHWRLFGG
jgi:dipeptidase E